ncbi:hypothetical protein [Streptomyces cellulosae]|uniref:Uncharacterized protein n=1 Tax=Streptomyces cellulosae TaxID=1968 RepID=A0ABW7YEQ4_STRCE
MRNNNGRRYLCTISQGQTQCYSPMVCDKGLTSLAEGVVDTAAGTA